MAEEGLFGALGRIASTFIGGAPDGHRYAWNAIAPWFQELSKAASMRWLPHLVHGINCQCQVMGPHGQPAPCPGSAIAACVACKFPVCLDHSFVSGKGDAICYVCAVATINAADKQHRAPPPPPGSGPDPRSAGGYSRAPGAAADPVLSQQLTAARKRLGVKKSASAEEINAAYRMLAKKWHPDRHPADRVTAERRFIAVTAARDLLLKHLEKPQ